MTETDVIAKIDATKSGGYDAYHEWNPSFSFAEKCAVLESLLSEWDSLEAGSRSLVLQFCRMLFPESRECEHSFSDVLVAYAHLPELSSLTGGLLSSPWFSLALLASMKARGLKQAEWLAAIRDNWANLKFAKDKRGLPVKEIYARVGSALDEIQSLFS